MSEPQTLGRRERPIRRDQLATTESRLLAALLDIGARGASIDDLARLLWRDVRPAQWRGLLHFHLGVLRTRLPVGVHVDTDVKHQRFTLHFDDPSSAIRIFDTVEASEQASRALARRLKQPTQALVVGNASPSTSRAFALLISDDPDVETYYVYGQGAPLVPFGAFAATFATLRSELLDMHDSGSHGTARIAWRLLSEYLTDRARVSRQRLLVEDAHLLDNESLELLSYLAIYPCPGLSQLIIAGDDADEREEWQALIRDLATSDFEVIASI